MDNINNFRMNHFDVNHYNANHLYINRLNINNVSVFFCVGGSTGRQQNPCERCAGRDGSFANVFIPRSRVRSRRLLHKQRVHGRGVARESTGPATVRQGPAKHTRRQAESNEIQDKLGRRCELDEQRTPGRHGGTEHRRLRRARSAHLKPWLHGKHSEQHGGHVIPKNNPSARSVTRLRFECSFLNVSRRWSEKNKTARTRIISNLPLRRFPFVLKLVQQKH